MCGCQLPESSSQHAIGEFWGLKSIYLKAAEVVKYWCKIVSHISYDWVALKWLLLYNYSIITCCHWKMRKEWKTLCSTIKYISFWIISELFGVVATLKCPVGQVYVPLFLYSEKSTCIPYAHLYFIYCIIFSDQSNIIKKSVEWKW